MFMRFTLQRGSVGALLPFLALACSADTVALGTVPGPEAGAANGRCAPSSVLDGDVVVTDQAGLDELAGCEHITGGLEIAPFDGATLVPLASLRRVGGALELGSYSWLLADPELATDFEDFIDQIEHLEALVQRGWLDSLDGLENLQSVAGLGLRGIMAPDLHALRGLENIGPRVDDGVVSGRLSVHHMPNLRDFSGLENAHGIGDIDVSGAQLESLDGLVVGESIAAVRLSAAPRLHDIEALGSVTGLRGITIAETGIESLEALVAWRGTDELTLWDNPALVDVSRIEQLELVGSINLKNNDALRSLPSLARFETLNAIFIVDNDSLEDVDLDLVLVQPRNFIEVGNQGNSGGFPTERIEVQRNQNLRRFRLAGTRGPADVQFLTVADNPALGQLDFPDLRKVDRLSLNSNATLSSVDAPALETVDTLEVRNNPALSQSAFDNVKTFEIRMSGNATP